MHRCAAAAVVRLFGGKCGEKHKSGSAKQRNEAEYRSVFLETFVEVFHLSACPRNISEKEICQLSAGDVCVQNKKATLA